MGRPLTFKTAEDLEKKIEEYFKVCEGEALKDDEDKPMLNKWGQPIIINQKPPTVTGLALFLGLNSRQAILNYQDREAFNDAITRAKAKIEEYAETRLYDKDGCNGAKFNLSNNFGWREKIETTGATTVNSNVNLSSLSTDEIKALLDKK